MAPAKTKPEFRNLATLKPEPCPRILLLHDPAAGRPTHALIPIHIYEALKTEIDSLAAMDCQPRKKRQDAIYSLSPIQFGARVKKARKRSDLTQEALALNMRVSQTWVSLVEKGKADLSEKIMRKFTLYLGKENFKED